MNLNQPSTTLHSSLFHQTAISVFHKTPYEWQVKVGASILSAVSRGESMRYLCVRPTGGGKTLVFTTNAATLKGITLCIVHLLSLGSDQVNKLISSTQSSDKIITAIHLDEVPISLQGKLLTYLHKYDAKRKTLIIFASPQSLLNPSSPILDCLIAESTRLSMVVMDEIHLACHFGNSFRKEFSDLKHALFDKLHSSIPFLFLTATCTARIKNSFESLYGFRITNTHWPSAKEMANRKVKLNVHYTTRPSIFLHRHLKDNVIAASSLPTKVIVYSNQRTKIVTCAEGIEGFFDNDDDLWNHDVITLIGTLTRDEKAHIIKTFLADDEPKLSVLCATSGVGNAGIDSPNIRAVYRNDFPPSILDISQECGRAGCRPDATPDVYSYNMCFSLEGFLHVYKRIHDKDNEVINNDYRQEQEEDLFAVAKLLASRTQCYYGSFEMYLGNPDIP
jgi:ATP-dependent DNA helicase RecQ